MKNFNQRWKKEDSVDISSYLSPDLVLFLDDTDRDQALKRLIDVLDEQGRLQSKEGFFRAILEREKIVSTGIGMGVAVPHAKLDGYKNFFIAVGIQKAEGIEWNALDGNPVHLIFLIGGPEAQQTEYLRILSSLTTAIKEEGCRKGLLRARNGPQVVALFRAR